ncbi:TadE/TadG family type IV pilus assembly protein [Brevundimonas sp.]|jgi:Flp pilus assembly protein TadG|uniref:TadE/TadG family type IV pilus assembly protein n=1 Tax=Brevundimonas sp. TaxID=1871086 RepID=UPI00356499D3
MWRRHERQPGGRRRRRREGAAAVEFAMVALPFSFMMFALLELGVIFTLDSVLSNAMLDSSRLIRTGQAQSANMTAGEFRDDLCGRMSVFATQCEERISIDVRVIPAFATVPPDPMVDGTTFDDSQLLFDPGTINSLVVVRVWYRQPLVTVFLNQALSRLGDGSARLMSITAFRNEP